MNTITLHYDFGREDEDPFDYQVDVNYADYLNSYFEERYANVEDAVEDLAEEGFLDDDEKKEAIRCKSLDDLANHIIKADKDLAESIVESDEDFIENYIEEDLKEENEDDAYDAYQDANDGCDPDGFYGWDDYWHWKNG
jgi:hypothetical protein